MFFGRLTSHRSEGTATKQPSPQPRRREFRDLGKKPVSPGTHTRRRQQFDGGTVVRKTFFLLRHSFWRYIREENHTHPHAHAHRYSRKDGFASVTGTGLTPGPGTTVRRLFFLAAAATAVGVGVGVVGFARACSRIRVGAAAAAAAAALRGFFSKSSRRTPGFLPTASTGIPSRRR